MEWYWALALFMMAIIVLMAIGMPVAFAFITTNIAAALYYFGGQGPWPERADRAIGLMLTDAFETMTTFALVPIPMFLLMGELFFHTGLAKRMFDAVDTLTGRLPARLSYVTVAGGTAFATLSGSSMGSTALLGTLMVPEMDKRGYKKHLSIGPILGTGGLAMLIPPSALAVLLGTLAKLDIGALLIAGVVPGLILAAMYVVLIFGMTVVDPEAAPRYAVDPVAWSRRIAIFLTDVLPMISVVVAVIALILAGWSTPSEAAAFGCLGVILLALAYRCLSWRAAWTSLIGATRVTAMSLLIIFGSLTFSKLLSFSGASQGLIGWATSFQIEPIAMLLVMFAILLLLGMFMDQLSMMMLTVPIFFPLAISLGFDPIWFGVVVLLSLEISFTTPPFGLLLFVMQGVAPKGTRYGEICLAALPFMFCALALVALLMFFPSLATWLPSLGR